MANYTTLIDQIKESIKTNGNGNITGQVLQDTLVNIVNTIGKNRTFAGAANINTNPRIIDENVFYIATQIGTYTNFGNISIYNLPCILYNNANNWNIYYIYGYSGFLVDASIQYNGDPSDYIYIDYLYRNTDSYGSGIRIYKMDKNLENKSQILYLSGLGNDCNGIKTYHRKFDSDFGELKIVVNWDVVPNQYNAILEVPIIIPQRYYNSLSVQNTFFKRPDDRSTALLEIYPFYERGLFEFYIDNLIASDISYVDMWCNSNNLYIRYKGEDNTLKFFQYSLEGVSNLNFDNITNYEPVYLYRDGIEVGFVVFRDKQQFINHPTSTGIELYLDIITNNLYHNYIWTNKIKSNEYGVNISLPDKIYAVVGDTLQLFYRGIIQAVNPYNYNILISCSKGKQYPRYFEYTPSVSDVGTTDFTITIRNDNLVQICTKTVKLVTVNTVKSPDTELKVMCFGDSLTEPGIWCHEANRRLTGSDGTPIGNSLSNITFVGSKKKENTGYFGVGGWTWNSYITKGNLAYRFQVNNVSSISIGSVYTNNGNTFTVREINVNDSVGNILCNVSSLSPEPTASGTLLKQSGDGDESISYSSVEQDVQNPLWDIDQDKMSFIPYANEVSDGEIDVVYTLLSWNGQSPAKTDFSDIINSIKIFANTLHSEFPDAKLKILGLQIPSVNGGMGANYGATGTSYADGYGMAITVLNQNEAYQNFANDPEYSSFVEFVNVSSQFDSENNMPNKKVPVNTRNSNITEKIDTNGIHPYEPGYFQIADIVYRNFIANFCQ